MILLSFVWYIKSLAIEGDGAQILPYRRGIRTRALHFQSSTAILNVFLGSLLLALLAYYVVATNSVIANEYRFRTLNDRLISVQEANSEFISLQKLSDSHAALLEYARSISMVEAREGIRIVQPGNVAFSR